MCSPSFFSPENYTDIAIRREKMKQAREASNPDTDQESKIKNSEPQESEIFDFSPPPYGSPGWCP